MESFLTFSTSALVHNSEDAKEEQQTKPHLWNITSSEEQKYLGQVIKYLIS